MQNGAKSKYTLNAKKNSSIGSLTPQNPDRDPEQ